MTRTSISYVISGEVTEPTPMMNLPGLIKDAARALIYRELTPQDRERLAQFIAKAEAMLEGLST